MVENNSPKETQIDLVVLFKSVWLKRKKVIRWALVGLVVGLIVAISTPKQYTSMVKIAPESQSKDLGSSVGMLASMIGVGTSAGYNGINEKIYPEIMKSTPFLMEFAPIEVEYKGEPMPLSNYILKHTQKPWWSYVIGFPGRAIGWVSSIGKDVADTLTIENSPAIQYAFVEMLSSGIQTKIEEKLGVITITSTFQNAKITKMVSDSMIAKLQRYMGNYHTTKTRNTLETTIELFDDAKSRYYVVDEAYAKAQDSNRNLISRRAEVAIERLENERDLAYQLYSQLAQQVESLRIKLQEETPVATIIEPATTPNDPSAPRVMVIIVLWTLLFAFVASISIVVKTLLEK